MNWNTLLIYSVAILSSLCPIGIILLLIHHYLWKKKRDRVEWDEDRLVRKLHNTLLEVTIESMDILPEKILEAKKTIEGE